MNHPRLRYSPSHMSEPLPDAIPGPAVEVPSEALSPAEAAFERWRRVVGAVAAPLALGLTYLLTAGRLTPQGQALSAVLAAVAALWVSEALPLPVTALLGAVLCVVMGVAPAKTVL